MPRQAVTGCPSFVSVAPITDEASATAVPHAAPFWCVQLRPPAGAVKVLMPPTPGAKRRSVPSGITSSASPPFPCQPVATDDVPIARPAGEKRVSKIDVVWAPRFQITCSTPSAVRARPSCDPGCVGPLIRFQPLEEPAALAAAANAARPIAAVSMSV